MLLPTESTAAGSPVVCPLRSSCGSAPSASHGLYPEILSGPCILPVPDGSCKRLPRIQNRYFVPGASLPVPCGNSQISDRKMLVPMQASDFRQKSFIVHISARLASALLRPKCRWQKKIIHMDHISAQFFCKSGSQCCLPGGASAVNGNNAHSGGKHTQFLCQLRNSSQRSHPQPPQCILPGVCSRLPR